MACAIAVAVQLTQRHVGTPGQWLVAEMRASPLHPGKPHTATPSHSDAETISTCRHQHPALKPLAFSFRLLVGLTLIAEGFEQPISKGNVHFAMDLSLLVELLNL